MTYEEIKQLIVDTIKSTTETKSQDESENVGEESAEENENSPDSTNDKEMSKEDIVALVKETMTEAMKQNSPNVGAPSNGGDVLDLDAVKRMSQDEINSRWDEVSKVLEADRPAKAQSNN